MKAIKILYYLITIHSLQLIILTTKVPKWKLNNNKLLHREYNKLIKKNKQTWRLKQLLIKKIIRIKNRYKIQRHKKRIQKILPQQVKKIKKR